MRTTLILFCFFPLWATAQNAKIDALFKEFDNPKVPGCSVAVVKDGKVVYRRAFGAANLEYEVKFKPDTPIHVASVSKQFTAFSIILLQAEGKLSLSDDVRKYVPELHNFGKTISIRHLLGHTSGLRDQWELCVLAGWRMNDIISQRDILRLLFNQTELNFEPGSQFMYCNSGYTLLAEIVSRVSGLSFPEFCRKRIFEPLGMKHSSFLADPGDIVPGRAVSYDSADRKTWKASILSYANYGATSLITTVDDMVKWDRNFDDMKVGGASLFKEFLHPMLLNNGSTTHYAAGIIVATYRGAQILEHAGGDAGFRSEFLRFPDHKLSIVILSNRSDMEAPTLAYQIADLTLENELKGPKTQLTPPATDLKAISLTPQAMDRFVGDYRFANGSVLSIRRENQKLVGRLDGGTSVELIPTSPTELAAPIVAARLVFKLPVEGQAESVDLLQGPTPQRAERTTLTWPTATELSEYEGSYYSPELNVTYKIVIKDGKLVVSHPRDEYPVAMTLPNHFGCELGTISFEKGATGITGFHLSSDRILNLWFRREPQVFLSMEFSPFNPACYGKT